MWRSFRIQFILSLAPALTVPHISNPHTGRHLLRNCCCLLSAISRGQCLANYYTEALLPLVALPLKVFQGYNNDFSVGPLSSPFPIVPGNHEIIPLGIQSTLEMNLAVENAAGPRLPSFVCADGESHWTGMEERRRSRRERRFSQPTPKITHQ